jgi:FolB domain-containing protein
MPMKQTAVITIHELEVFYCVGVPDEERANPQRLLLTIEMEVDAAPAAASDRIEDTVDYFQVSRDLLGFGENRGWRLIEKLASDIADHVLRAHRPLSVSVEVRKFPIPEARCVSVKLTRDAGC